MANKHFTVRELVEHPSFRRLVKGTASPEEIEEWNGWMEEDDHNRQQAKKAISEITGFEFRSHTIPDVQEQWAKLYSGTSGAKMPKHTGNRRAGRERKEWIVRVAAVLLLTSLVGIGVYNYTHVDKELTHLEQLTEEQTISTQADEQKTLTFSNGARIVLNSNSRLTYSLGLIRNQTILVNLEGEAWFDVENNPSAEPAFAVQTPDGIIRDIGTKFLVTVQQGKTRVVLQEGIVEVEHLQAVYNDHNRENAIFRVEEGEMVEFTRADVLTREQVNPTFYTAWATQFMQFDQTGLSEFAEYIEKRYGVDVEITDSSLEEITLDGAVYFRSLDELVRSVAEVTGIPVYRSDTRDRVYVGEFYDDKNQ